MIPFSLLEGTIYLSLLRIPDFVPDDPVVTDGLSVCDGVLPVQPPVLQTEHDLIRQTQSEEAAIPARRS